MRITIPRDCWDEYSYPLEMMGTAHSVSADEPPDDPAEQVRKIAEEVTGKSFERPTRRMGFL